REQTEQDAPDLEHEEALHVQLVPGMDPDPELLAFGAAQHLPHGLEGGADRVHEPARDRARLAQRGTQEHAPHASDDGPGELKYVEVRIVTEADPLEERGGPEEVDELLWEDERPGVERVHDPLDHLLDAPGPELTGLAEDLHDLGGRIPDLGAG